MGNTTDKACAVCDQPADRSSRECIKCHVPLCSFHKKLCMKKLEKHTWQCLDGAHCSVKRDFKVKVLTKELNLTTRPKGTKEDDDDYLDDDPRSMKWNTTKNNHFTKAEVYTVNGGIVEKTTKDTFIYNIESEKSLSRLNFAIKVLTVKKHDAYNAIGVRDPQTDKHLRCDAGACVQLMTGQIWVNGQVCSAAGTMGAVTEGMTVTVSYKPGLVRFTYSNGKQATVAWQSASNIACAAVAVRAIGWKFRAIGKGKADLKRGDELIVPCLSVFSKWGYRLKKSSQGQISYVPILSVCPIAEYDSRLAQELQREKKEAAERERKERERKERERKEMAKRAEMERKAQELAAKRKKEEAERRRKAQELAAQRQREAAERARKMQAHKEEFWYGTNHTNYGHKLTVDSTSKFTCSLCVSSLALPSRCNEVKDSSSLKPLAGVLCSGSSPSTPKHLLTYGNPYNSWICDTCRSSKTGARYNCNVHKVDICMPCYNRLNAIPSQTKEKCIVKCARGDANHPLLFTSGVYNPWWCDDCKKKVYQKVRWHCPTHKSDICPTCYGKRGDSLRATMSSNTTQQLVENFIVSLPKTEQELNALTPEEMNVILKEQKRDASACGTNMTLLLRKAGFTVVTGMCGHTFHEDCLMSTKNPKCPTCKQFFRPKITENYMTYARINNVFVPSIRNAPHHKISHLEENRVNVSTAELGKLGQLLTQMMCKTSGPAYWDKLKPGENDALVELPSWSEEYKEALRLFRKTVTNKTMVKIERIQNTYLYQKYTVRKIQMVTKNKGIVNERLLFHGTRAARPGFIWDGLNAGGFDPRLGQGYYGIGAYFAEKSSYSLAYEYRGLPGGLKQMFLASVLCGHSKVYGTTLAKTLKRAPDLPAGHSCYPGLYDSVQGGPHSGSLMWIVYHSDQAYPRYLYTYK